MGRSSLNFQVMRLQGVACTGAIRIGRWLYPWLRSTSLISLAVLAIQATGVARAADPQAGIAAAADPRDPPSYHATVRRGPYGVAHISADDFGSLGYGEAYAAAEDHLCNIAYELMRARGETARYLGAGAGNSNLAWDAVIRGLDVAGQSQRAFDQQAPEIQRWLRGYSAGFNRYLREMSGRQNGTWCSGARWLTETSAQDMTARMVVLALTLPRISGAIAAAAPPLATSDSVAALFTPDVAGLDGAALSGMGSNGWALGKNRTENGRGMLLANPHYPWYGGNRFWEKHLSIPGTLDAYGVGLLGTPGVAIGFNRALGWTHTVSASQRLVMYELALDPENPMRYRHGDAWKDIQKREVDIQVRGEDGEVTTLSHSIFFSHHGPLLVMPNMSWSATTAFAVRDANSGNYDLLAQWLAMGQAQDMDGFIEAHRAYAAMPWVNTIATSADGRAVYLDNSNVGYLSRGAQRRWQASLDDNAVAAGLFAQRRMVLLDGSDPRNDWVVDPEASLFGTVPFAQRPLLERDDYVFNSNDSYWLTNPSQPMSGASILYGPTGTARSLRSRMNIRMLENSYGDAGTDARFSIGEIQSALFANRGYTAELLKDELTSLCKAQDDSLAQTCEVLENYDGSLNLDSPGAVLFREWVTRYEYRDSVSSGALFRVPFDASDPVATPRSLGDPDFAIKALRDAIVILAQAGLSPSATLREAQFAWRGGEAIAIHGGNRLEGVANLQMSNDPSASPIAGVKPVPIGDSRYLTDKGYPVVHGSSFILTLGFDDAGPVAEALLSYSQSGNPGAAHFKDQTLLYADKTWRELAFHAKDVERNTRSIHVLRRSDEP